MAKRKTVFVGLSGGVDSSVAAALLKERGYNVVGVFMQNWSEAIGCDWDKERKDALAVAQKLGIPFKVYNFEKEYQEQVIEEFFQEYAAGRTPNPDMACNQKIKFGTFLQRALAEGADLVATGHYARVKKAPVFTWRLLKAVDQTKDQSYFLATLNQKQLSKVLFPIGDYRKTQVREIAATFGLPTAAKKDSQGICFVGNVALRDFLATRFPIKKGKVINTDGMIVGEHDGVWFYTIGQRHGLRLSGKGVNRDLPYYVVEKDAGANQLTVALGRHHAALYSQSLVVSNIHWISGALPKLPLACQARIRYRQVPQEVILSVVDGLWPARPAVPVGRLAGGSLVFDQPQWAITPGQYVVLYDGDEVLGSGVIERPVAYEMGFFDTVQSSFQVTI